MPKPRKVTPTISEEVKAIHTKIKQNEKLTPKEKKLEVAKDEAAYILSAVAGRPITTEYIKQLIRDDKKTPPRLSPAGMVGDSYLYTVESLLGVRFTKAHDTPEAETDPAT